MATPFADLELRVDASVLGRMPNAVATLGLESADVVFVAASEVSDEVGVVTLKPTFLAAVADLQSADINSSLTVDGVPYVVRRIQSAYAGWRRFILARA